MLKTIARHPIRTLTILQPIIFAVVHYLSNRGSIGHDEVILVTTIVESLAAGLVGRQIKIDQRMVRPG